MLFWSKYSVRAIAAWVLVCLATGSAGAMFTRPAIESWYNNLNIPWFTPSSELFAPVWTVLYLVMGLTAGMVWSTERNDERALALKLFTLQLSLNALWSPVFFGLRSPLAGMIVILPLLVAAAVCALAFYRIECWAGILLVPYLFWLSFAALLNGAILFLN